MTGEIILVINRLTFRDLQVTKDGRHYTLKPGENHINSDLLRFARAQNPIPGTRDPVDLTYTSLVGVPGKHDCTPIDEDEYTAMAGAGEALDRSKLDPKRQHVTFQHVPGPDPRKRVGIEAPTLGMINMPGERPANG